MKVLILRSRSRRGRVFVRKWDQGTLSLGFGMNFRDSPSRERRFFGGLILVVKSWKDMLVGRVKYCHGGIRDKYWWAL